MPTYTRRDALRAGLATAGAALAGCARGGAEAITVTEGFESDLQGWETRAAIGPEVDVADFEWAIERSTERAHTGEWALRVFTEGDYDDGTAWATRTIPVATGQAYDATVTVQAWSESESFNLLRNLVAYLGADRPTAESDFPDPGRNSTGIADAPIGGLREPLHRAAGWEEYRFEWRSPPLETNLLYVAVGVSVVWETDATHYVDDLRVELTPRSG